MALFYLNACDQGSFEPGEAIHESKRPSDGESFVENSIPEKNSEAQRCLRSLYFNRTAKSQEILRCQKADDRQLAMVNEGNLKKDEFLSQCYAANNNSCWCDQLVRPNPDSISTFHCTYGSGQVHQLIHPDESTWKYAFEAVALIRDLESLSISADIIYNWWRPEPYNDNVGGSPKRHPFGTSIDVRFKTKFDQLKAHTKLCQWRNQGRLRALGYYQSTALHFGVGDYIGNTWGKSCP